MEARREAAPLALARGSEHYAVRMTNPSSWPSSRVGTGMRIGVLDLQGLNGVVLDDARQHAAVRQRDGHRLVAGEDLGGRIEDGLDDLVLRVAHPDVGEVRPDRPTLALDRMALDAGKSPEVGEEGLPRPSSNIDFAPQQNITG